MMCSEYVTSSASTRIRSGSDAVDAAVPGLQVDLLELREEPLQLRVAAAPERKRAADEVLPGAALRLAEPERRRCRTSGVRRSAGSTPW